MPDVSAPGSTQGVRSDRLQPALLDRLTDLDPTRRTESPDEATMSRTRLREAVLRDLSWLLNTTSMEAEVDLAAFPEVRRSVANFGLPALAGQRISEIDWQELEFAIRDAITTFEPRLLPATISVRAVATPEAIHHLNVLSFEIRAQLWSMPFPLELLLRSQVDLEDGSVELVEQTAVVKPG